MVENINYYKECFGWFCMSIAVPVDVKMNGRDVPASLMLKGFFSSETLPGSGALISLGSVDILRTTDDYLESDMKRFEREARNETLSIGYDWNVSLIPVVEMMEERKSTIRKLRDSLRHMGYKTSLGHELPDHEVLYTFVSKIGLGAGVSEMRIGRDYFNINGSGFYVDVSCNIEPTDEKLDALNTSARIASSATYSWGSRSEDIGPFHYKIKCGLPTRTEPSDISKSLSRTASMLLKVLQE